LFSAFYAESSTALKISFQQKATLNLSFKVAFLVRPTGFEPAAYRVGVIRPSSRKALRRKALIGLAQISGILRKNLGSLAGQDFRGFSR